MAGVNIFTSSTCYDLSQVRQDLLDFISGLGHNPMMYKKVHSKIPANEIDGWSVEELLSNSGIMIDGKLTRAAIILLGKPTAVF